MHISRRILSSMAFVISLSPVASQAQAPAATPPPPPRREATAEFAYVGTNGNSSTTSIGLGGQYIYRPEEWTLTTKAAYVKNESQGVLSAESVDALFKAERALGPRLSTFARYGFLHDLFAGIEARNIIEGGLNYLLVNAAPQTLNVDASFGYAHESRIDPPDLSDPLFATGAVYRLKLSEVVDLNDDARFSVALSDGGDDWRFANIASVNSKLNSFLSLKFSNTIRYVHAPAPTFKTTDTITAVALVAKF
jgi:putative salt-induced outer membrane protein YdiY